jgi:hypothetical protein
MPWLIHSGEDVYDRNGVRVLGWKSFFKESLC